MNKSLSILVRSLTISTSVFFITNAQSAGTPASSPLTYYKLGGGESVSLPVVLERPGSVAYGPSFKLPSLCNLWDYRHLDDVLDRYGDMVRAHIEGEIDQLGQTLMTNIVANATGLLAASIQRAMPGMYSLTQTSHGQISTKIRFAKTSCEAVMKEANGNGPLDPWKKLSRAEGWKRAMGLDYDAAGNINVTAAGPGIQNHILDAQTELAETDGDTGIDWIGGTRGGRDQEPVTLTADLVTAGSNVLAGRTNRALYGLGNVNDIQIADTSTLRDPLPDQPSMLTKHFPSTDDAVEWSTLVVGEQTISTCSAASCNPSTESGIGLQSAYYNQRTLYVERWAELLARYDAGDTITIEDMQTVSGGNVHYVQEVLYAVHNMIRQEQAMYVDRLASDAAVSDTVEKAFTVIRLIEVSQKLPEVMAHSPAHEEARRIVQTLREQIENIMFEIDISKKLASNTALNLIKADRVATLRGSLINEGGTNESYDPEEVDLTTGDPIRLEDLGG